MKNLFRHEDGSLSGAGGSEIKSTIDEAISLASTTRRVICFKFNDVTITVTGKSNAKLIHRDWHRRYILGTIDKDVGPHPKETLSEEELARDVAQWQAIRNFR